MKHLESAIQKQCFYFFELQYREFAGLLFAVPNGGKRNAREAAIMKAEGVRAGVADALLLVARGQYHGLAIEFKTATGRQSPAQKEFENKVTNQGYKYAIVKSFDDFMQLIENYLSL